MPATYESIATTTLSSTQTSVSFSTISNAYTDLILVAQTKFTTNSDAFIALRFNSDTASNYSNTYLLGTGSSPSSGRSSNVTSGRIGNGSNSSEYAIHIAHIQNYANATTFKTVISRSNSTAAYVSAYVSVWRKTPEAITDITIVNDSVTFDIGSTFTLYGIKAA